MLEFHGSVVTSDAGLLAYRELDDALGLNPSAGKLFADSRTGKNGRHALLGWKSSERLGRIAKSDGAIRDELSGHWFDQVTKRRACKRVVLEQSVWNEHFGCTCYHPLFVFNQFGDMERCSLRPGNVHSADAWEAVLKPVVARYQGTAESIAFQGDAASCPAALQELSLQDKAASWPHPRRVAAKVEWHLGELFPRVGFIVTNLRYASKNEHSGDRVRRENDGRVAPLSRRSRPQRGPKPESHRRAEPRKPAIWHGKARPYAATIAVCQNARP